MPHQHRRFGKRALHRLIPALLLLPAAAHAADKPLSVTDFDRLRVIGAFDVVVTGGKPSAAILSGSAAAIDHTRVEVQGRTLTVSRNRTSWGGYPGEDAGVATVRLNVPQLVSIGVSGAGKVRVDRMRAPGLTLALDGSGTLSVTGIEADRLDVGLAGAGRIVAGGRVADARVALRGSGDFDGSALTIADAVVKGDSSGTITLNAKRSANVVATGSGDVTILGAPACTVVNNGAGRVTCGSQKPQRR